MESTLRRPSAFPEPHLLVLVGSHSYELGLWKAVAGDHALWAPNSHNVNPGLILMQGVQHDLQEIRSKSEDQRLPQHHSFHGNCSGRNGLSYQRLQEIACSMEGMGSVGGVSRRFTHLLPTAGLELECEVLCTIKPWSE